MPGVFRLRNWWGPVLAASCVLLTLAAYAHELSFPLLCWKCCCTVGILVILCDFACALAMPFAGVVCRDLMVAGCWAVPPTLPECSSELVMRVCGLARCCEASNPAIPCCPKP